MATRVVLHIENLERVPTGALLRDLADDVARDARGNAKVLTGRLAQSVEVEAVTERHAIVVATAAHPDQVTSAEYSFWVEKGTSDTPAMPFMRPALYRYRTAR